MTDIHKTADKGLSPWILGLGAGALVLAVSTATVVCINTLGISWVAFEGGSFSMGSAAGLADEQPVHEVTLSPFELADTEVTVRQYRLCVNAGVCTKPDKGTWCNWGKPNRYDHPINCVDWTQAATFCQWIGGRLPTEAEWEFAARAGGKEQLWPWGDNKATCERAILAEHGEVGCYVEPEEPQPKKKRRRRPPKPTTGSVCSKSDGNTAQGLCDMGGNVWEWVSDWYGPYAVDAPSNPQGPAQGELRVRRGGAWSFPAESTRVAVRSALDPTKRYFSVGFRVAR